MKKIILAGGSGFLGRSFEAYAQNLGWEIIILTRTPKQPNEIAWDGQTLGDWVHSLKGAEAVVNFTGRSVNCLYTPENRREILDSRLDSVRVIQQALTSIPDSERPKSLIQGASLAIYGNTQELCVEDSPHGEGFSVEVCQQWESAFFENPIPQVRKCLLRIGFALGANGGALAPLRQLTQAFLGGSTGSGTQYISWLHVDDLNRMILRCIEDASLEGTFNATGIQPVTNKEFMQTMRHALQRPWSPPVPSLAVRFGAKFILKTEADLALTGRKCLPKRFQDIGFTFEHRDLQPALEKIFQEWKGYAA